MKGDFTRDTFHPEKHYSRVLMQQGRVLLDADFNEEVSLSVHQQRTFATDLIGSHGGPVDRLGFRFFRAEDGTYRITQGRYYVDGLACENNAPRAVELQLDPNQPQLVYLDAWERPVTCLEDEHLREKALGPVDTCIRAQAVWRVRNAPVPMPAPIVVHAAVIRTNLAAAVAETRAKLQTEMLKPECTAATVGDAATKLAAAEVSLACVERELGTVLDVYWQGYCTNTLQAQSSGLLRAQLKRQEGTNDLCSVAPAIRYRGRENHLYRVEVHDGGPLDAARFKWSRDNGSVATQVIEISGNRIQVAQARAFAPGDWVEFCDEDVESGSGSAPKPLQKLASVEGDSLIFAASALPPAWAALEAGSRLRCWNGILPPGVQPEAPYDVEDGVQIGFLAGSFRTGDYWLIPARAIDGSIEWPSAPAATFIPPHGIKHHYAPLALAVVGANGGVPQIFSLQHTFEPLATLASAAARAAQPAEEVVTPAPAATPAAPATPGKSPARVRPRNTTPRKTGTPK